MHKAFIDSLKCLRFNNCHAATACPVKAIFRIDKDGSAVVELNVCYGCGDCVQKCSGEAISLKEN